MNLKKVNQELTTITTKLNEPVLGSMLRALFRTEGDSLAEIWNDAVNSHIIRLPFMHHIHIPLQRYPVLVSVYPRRSAGNFLRNIEQTMSESDSSAFALVADTVEKGREGLFFITLFRDRADFNSHSDRLNRFEFQVAYNSELALHVMCSKLKNYIHTR